jgi:hypothetical protein
MSLILKKYVRKININGKSKMEFNILKKNNKKITAISGDINNTGVVKIRKFNQVPIIKGPNKFTLNIHQIKDIMNIDKITPIKRSKSVKKEKNIDNVKRNKSVKKEKKIVKSKDSKHSKSVKKEKKVIKSKDSKHSKTVKKEKKVVKSKGSNINKKTVKNNLEK